MDMQNVSDLVIPEGGVKAIHDKDGNLLWGRIAYDTTYGGNIKQQTYSGKNLFNKNASTTTAYTNTTASATTTGIRVTAATAATQGTFSWVLYVVGNTADYVGKTLTVSAGMSPSSTNKPTLSIGICNANGSSATGLVNSSTTPAVVSKSITQADADSRAKICLVFYATAGTAAAANYYVDYTNVQLEVGSTVTTYEPYVGGVPAPNPDYPQNIKTVTGSQTVSVSDGINSRIFPLSLGAMELCKIGTYQDYIYKSGDDWYVHKEIEKEIYNGSEDWGLWAAFDTMPRRFGLRNNSMWFKDNMMLKSNYFIRGIRDSQVDLEMWTQTEYLVITDNAGYWSSASDFKTWLSSHNTTVYHEIQTPTNTKITDSTLIGQLNAIHQWSIRYGYGFTVSGDIPIKVVQTYKLPAGYTRVECIAAQGYGAWCTTGIIADLNTEMEITASNITSNSSQLMVAETNGTGTTQFRIVKTSADQKIAGSVGAQNIVTNNDGADKFTARLNVNAFYFNDELIGNFSTTVTLGQYNIDIFSGKYGVSRYYAASGSKFHEAIIWKNGVEVFHGVPAKNSSDVYGIYDTVTNTFLVSQGTGTFIDGSS